MRSVITEYVILLLILIFERSLLKFLIYVILYSVFKFTIFLCHFFHFSEK